MRFHCIIATSLLIITPMGGYLLSASESSGSFPSAGTQVEKILLKGKVTDEHGEPLAGAMVMLKGTTTGTMTDSDGRYELLVPQGKKDLSVIFSYLGMVQQEHPFTGQAVLNIQMVADNEIEAAVIDVGYGLLQKREDLTGSAFEVKSVDIAKKPAARIDNLLAGIVPGLVVNEDKSSGRTKVSIRIRGEGSLSASCEPLWIIDGIPVYTGSSTNSVYGTSYSVSPLSFLNPDDIESMTVLKDAATTTIYGADGANGVILVNTKKAQSGKTVYNASVRYGISRVDRSTTLKVLNADQWWQVAEEAWTNAGKSMSIFPYQDSEYNSYSTTDTDWFDVYMRTGHTAEARLTASGGSDKLKNYFSASYYFEKTPYSMEKQDAHRVSVRDNLNLAICKGLNLDAQMSISYRNDDIANLYSFYDQILPIFSPYNDDGSFRLYNYYSTSDTAYEPSLRKFHGNVLPEALYNDNNQRTLEADVNARLSYTILPGLEVSSLTSFSTRNTYENTYVSKQTVSGMSSTEGMSGNSRRASAFSYIFKETLRANFNRTFKDRHSVNAVAGVEFKDSKYATLYATAYGFPSDNLKEISFANKETLSASSTISHTRTLSFLMSANYVFDRRYGISLTGRAEGNSSFNTYSQWGYFASGGLTWNVHNEDFFKNDVMHLLKLRASFGDNGNSRVDTSASYGSYSILDGKSYGGTVGATQMAPANPGLSWEMVYTTNIGLDFGFCKRVEVQMDYYHRLTDKMIYGGRVSSVITSGTVNRNIGQITNDGIEFNITSTNIKHPNFVWTTSLNGTHNKNIIKKLYKDTYSGFFDTIWTEGACKNALWLVRWAGVDPTNGAPMWYDKNGNLTYTFSYADRVLLPEYSTEPALYGGMTNRFEIKDFSVGFTLRYSFGGWDLCSLTSDGYDVVNENETVEILDHWTRPGDVSENPRLLYKHSYHASNYSTRNLIKKTYIQLTNLYVTYRIPERHSKKLGMKGISVSLIGDNLYTWTPAQNLMRNSYKTIMMSDGITRSITAELQITF